MSVAQFVVFDDPRGMRHYDQPFLHSYSSVQEQGEAFARVNPGYYEEQVAKGAGTDVAIILYTSGTTGNPKGVILTHDNVLITARNSVEFENLTAEDEVLAYLPMAWVGDNIFSFGQSYVAGFCVNCPEGAATVTQDLKEIGPTYYFAPPAIFENLLTSVSIRIEDAKCHQAEDVPLLHEACEAGGDRNPRRPSGIGSGPVPVLAGEPSGLRPAQEHPRVSRASGLRTPPARRSAPTSSTSTVLSASTSSSSTARPRHLCSSPYSRTTRFAPTPSVAPPPQVELRIADDGEVLYRSPGVFQRYYKNEEATRETKTDDGWVHTGDAGLIDQDGHLRIIDRAKDVGKLNDGSMFAPKFIENKMKFFPYIAEAVTFGHGRDHVSAFVNIDLDAVSNWAERNNIVYASYQELAAHPRVYELVRGCIVQVNADLAGDPQLSSSRIRRFLVLHKELDADDGELTRTRKVRRRIIAERYAPLIDALYSGADTCHIETEVIFEDGRRGQISADLRIDDVESFEVAMAKAS